MKKIITILLSLFLLVACTTKKENINTNSNSNNQADNNITEDSGEYYLNLLKNYEVLYKDPSSTKDDNKEFNEFLDKVFKETIESDYMYMHSSVSDYKSFGLTKPEVTLGELEYCIDEESIDEQKAYLNELLSFDYDSLSYNQQIDYDLFKYSLYETLGGLYYDKYTLLFSSNTDFSSNLVTNLVEFAFNSKEDLDDYLTILNDTSRYIDDAIFYTDNQMKDGLYHTDFMLDEQIEYLESVAVEKDNTIISSFETALEDINFIDENKKNEYKEKVNDIVLNSINPSLKKLSEYLNTLYDKTTSEKVALCAIDKNYAEFKFIVSSSNNESIDTLFNDLIDYYNDLVNDYNEFISSQDAIDAYYAIYDNKEPLNLEYKDQLEYLKNNMDDKYTNIGDVDYIVSVLDTLGSSTAAYYVTAPLDNLNQNVIRVNANNSGSDQVSNFEILAHEGFPGHLYQNIWFMKYNPHNFRHTQGFSGYTEGWADMASYDALALLTDNSLALSYIYATSVTTNSHIVFSILSILVNYYGYSKEEFKEYAQVFGITDDYVDYYYDYVVSMGTTYAIYGVGFISHLDIRENAKEELGDKFTYNSYHDTLLKNGPVPFVLLRQIVNNYIDSNK